MPRWILIHILSFISAIIISIIAIGELLTGPAPSSVDSLISDFPVESVQFPDKTNTNVHGWLAYGDHGKGVVLLVHSMRSNRLEMLSRARFLNALGYSTLLIDLQAHGESPGKRITFGARESESVEAAVIFLRDKFSNERIAAIGVSLGAAAIVLANNSYKFDVVILESLHPTLEEAVENRLKLHFGEFGPILSPLLLSQLSFYLDIPTSELNPITHINNLNAPLLLISGTNDAHTTLPETERLYIAARVPKDIWIIPGAGHFNMHTYAGRIYEQRITDFLNQYLRGDNIK